MSNDLTTKDLEFMKFLDENLQELDIASLRDAIVEASTEMITNNRAKSDIIGINIPKFIGEDVWDRCVSMGYKDDMVTSLLYTINDYLNAGNYNFEVNVIECDIFIVLKNKLRCRVGVTFNSFIKNCFYVVLGVFLSFLFFFIYNKIN